jgi:hypothetical protein
MVLGDRLGRRHLNTPLRFLNEPAAPELGEPALDEHGAQLRAAPGAR